MYLHLSASKKPLIGIKRSGSEQNAFTPREDQPRMALRSFSGVEMGMILKFLTSTFSTFGVTKAGSVGPSRMFLMPSDSRVSRMATAFCSYQDRTSESGSSFTPTLKALESASAIWTAE